MSEMVERVTKAIVAVVGTTMGCGSDRCCCWGLEAFECKTGLDVKDIARSAIEAMRELPERPGPKYDAGWYSRETHEAAIDDALGKVDA